MNVRTAFLTFLTMLSTASYAVESIDFSYSYPPDNEWFGYKRAETYDVAVRIKNPSLTGSLIKSIGVSIPHEYVVPNSASAWISSELILEKDNEGKKVNMPDITSVAATMDGDSLMAVFTEPIVMPAEGVYVGYSFSCEAPSDNNPLPIVAVGSVAEQCLEDGWWMHASKSLVKWNNLGTEKGLASKLRVTFTGEFHDNAASLALPQKLWNVTGCDGSIRAVISNNGSLPLKEVEYIYTVEGTERTGRHVFEEPLAPCFGYPVEFRPEIAGMDLSGWHELTMEITKVNGDINRDLARQSEARLDLVPFMPVSRPLVEEYTGLWCGWCPSGYVILEQMYDDYPENFVGVSYHTRDVMTVCEEEELPSAFKSLPAMFINRGEEYNPLAMKRPWEKTLSEVPPAEMELRLSCPSDSVIKGTCTVRFINDHEGSAFKVSYILIADNLHDPEWMQANYYNGNTFDDLKGPYSDIFNFGPEYISDLRYDHVAIAFSDGEEGSSMLPTEISVDDVYETSCMFDVSKAINLSGENFFNPETVFRVVAVLHDENGQILTCVRSDAIGVAGSGIPEAETYEKKLVERSIYTPGGMKCGNPGHGIYLIRTEYSDGTSKIEKVVR